MYLFSIKFILLSSNFTVVLANQSSAASDFIDFSFRSKNDPLEDLKKAKKSCFQFLSGNAKVVLKKKKAHQQYFYFSSAHISQWLLHVAIYLMLSEAELLIRLHHVLKISMNSSTVQHRAV